MRNKDEEAMCCVGQVMSRSEPTQTHLQPAHSKYWTCHNLRVGHWLCSKPTGTFYITSWQEEEEVHSNSLLQVIWNRNKRNPLETKWSLPHTSSTGFWKTEKFTRPASANIHITTKKLCTKPDSILFITVTSASWAHISKTEMDLIYSTFWISKCGMPQNFVSLDKHLLKKMSY